MFTFLCWSHNSVGNDKHSVDTEHVSLCRAVLPLDGTSLDDILKAIYTGNIQNTFQPI